MAVVEAADIEARYSVTSGSAGDSTAGTAAGSLGKYMSTTAIADATLGNIIPNVAAAQNAAGITLYRCVFVFNNGLGTWDGVRTRIESQESGGADVAIGLDPEGVVDSDSASAQAAEIADGETAPAGVTFSAPSDFDGGLVVGEVGPDQCFAVWLRAKVLPNSRAKSDDQAVILTRGITEESA